MKNFNLDSLKRLTGFFLILGIILYVFILLSPIIGSYIIPISKPHETYSEWLAISINTIHIDSIWDQILLFFSILNYSILLYAIYQFRSLLILFQKSIIFEKTTQKQLKLIGKLIIWSAFIFFIIEILLIIIHWERHTKMFNLYLVFMLVGYFFDVLADVFKRGRKLKKENELTI